MMLDIKAPDWMINKQNEFVDHSFLRKLSLKVEWCGVNFLGWPTGVYNIYNYISKQVQSLWGVRNILA